jgi:hypothetical protein
MAIERLGNVGYFAFIKQADKNVPLTPTNFLPLYNETLSTNANYQKQNPIYGGKFDRFATLQGQRSHQGDILVLAEANSIARLLDFELTKGTTTGAGPYTHPLDFSAATNPNYACVDISTGNVVKRFWGVGLSSFTPDMSDNEMRAKFKASGIGSFQGRTIKTVATTTLTLETKYDPVPNKGLVVGDLVRIFKPSTEAILDTTIATVNADGVTVTLAASAAAFAAGDVIHLRPATPTFALLETFSWAKTKFQFGATAAAALAASQTQVEPGSSYEILHPFKDDNGEKRSGSYDPATLIRVQGDATLAVKKFFDTPEEIKKYNEMEKSALVIRHFAGANNEYELRVTFHNLTTDNPVANIASGEVNYANLSLLPNYDQTDGKAVSVTVINNLATI